MANKNLFKTATPGPKIRPTDTLNEAGGRAYTREDRSALAQYAATGTLASTFYATAKDQLDQTLKLAQKADPEFIAKVAIYSRERGFMKDMPALLTAVLAGRLAEHYSVVNTLSTELGLARKSARIADIERLSKELAEAQATLASPAGRDAERRLRVAYTAAFGRCIDNGKMLRNFVQILRAGTVGRKAVAASSIRRMIQAWFDGHSEEQLVWASVGNEPTLLDIIKLGRVDPRTPGKRAVFKWLAGAKPGEKDAKGFEYKPDDLPALVKDFESWKKNKQGQPPRVPFQMLTALELTKADWTTIAKRASWTETRMNLNTFARHGVFDEAGMTDLIAGRIQDRELIARAKMFPFQLLTAYNYVSTQPTVPQKVKTAIQVALDISLSNIPAINGKVYVLPDVSGSMNAPITGDKENEGKGAVAKRKGLGSYQHSGSATVVSCREVAALISAAFLRRNQDTTIVPFNDRVHTVQLNPLDSLHTNAQKLAALPPGGTNCSLPLVHLNALQAKGDLVVFVSDYESWLDNNGHSVHANTNYSQVRQDSGVLAEWAKFKARNPKAKLVCIDLAPSPTSQVYQREDILMVGGFSDRVFDVIAAFANKGSLDAWVDEIDSIRLEEVASTGRAGDDEVAP